MRRSEAEVGERKANGVSHEQRSKKAEVSKFFLETRQLRVILYKDTNGDQGKEIGDQVTNQRLTETDYYKYRLNDSIE